MLPVIAGSCPDCGSADIAVLSRSPATYEVFCQCGVCGGDWWEEDAQSPDALNLFEQEAERAAA